MCAFVEGAASRRFKNSAELCAFCTTPRLLIKMRVHLSINVKDRKAADEGKLCPHLRFSGIPRAGVPPLLPRPSCRRLKWNKPRGSVPAALGILLAWKAFSRMVAGDFLQGWRSLWQGERGPSWESPQALLPPMA